MNASPAETTIDFDNASGITSVTLAAGWHRGAGICCSIDEEDGSTIVGIDKNNAIIVKVGDTEVYDEDARASAIELALGALVKALNATRPTV